jgi:hypothetical protein
MSVANSLILQTSQSQSAQITALTAQVAALTASVSANSAQVASNLASITSLAFADQQVFVVKAVADSGQVFNSGDVEVLFDDPPEASISGKYVFKISGVIQSDGQPLRAVVYFENTTAGAVYQYGVEATGSNELSLAYTGFLEYVVGQTFPKISMTGVMASGLWGWQNISLTLYRVQQIPNP